MTAVGGSARMRSRRAALVRRRLTRPDAGALDLVEWSSRSVRISDRDGHVAFRRDRVEAPAPWSNLAIAAVARRYFATDSEGRPESSVRGLVERVVGAIASWALEAGQVGNAEERDALREELAALVLTQRGTFATPVWLNAGLTERPLTSACFILQTEDSIARLLDWNTQEGMIFQQGGGAGINLSQVRSSHEPVSRGGLASGPVSFMRATDAWAATIGAGCRGRRGAKMIVLDASHPDVFEFIEAKALEEDRGRALLAAGFPLEEVLASLSFQHANHSVRVSDEFMRLVVGGGEWSLRAVTNGEVMGTLPARRVLRACAEAVCRCGDPGLQFADQIARWHTCPNTGPVTASNPCGEFLHVADSACNLATLNLLAFLEDRAFDVEAFTAAVELLVVAQDAIVDGSGYPSEAIERNARRLLQIGIGYANLAALLLTLGLRYDSDAGRDWAAAITALMSGVAYRRSAELAEALGPFKEFERNREPMLAVIERHIEELRGLGGREPTDVVSAAGREWARALELGRRHGFRNAQTTLIPPTGTVTLMLDCETTGIEPYYAPGTVKHFADGSRVTPMAHLQMVAAVQPFVSGGVSKTVLLPADTSVHEIEDAFIAAWRLGLKSVALYLEGSKLAPPLTADEE